MVLVFLLVDAIFPTEILVVVFTFAVAMLAAGVMTTFVVTFA